MNKYFVSAGTSFEWKFFKKIENFANENFNLYCSTSLESN